MRCLGWLSTDGTLDSFFETSDAEGIDEGQIQLGGVRQHHLSMKSLRLSFDFNHMSVQLIQFRFLVQHMSVVFGLQFMFSLQLVDVDVYHVSDACCLIS